MLFVWQLIRYGSMLLLILLILAQNPKVNGMNTFVRTNRYLDNVRNTESLLNNVSWVLVLIFLVSTTLLASVDVYNF